MSAAGLGSGCGDGRAGRSRRKCLSAARGITELGSCCSLVKCRIRESCRHPKRGCSCCAMYPKLLLSHVFVAVREELQDAAEAGASHPTTSENSVRSWIRLVYHKERPLFM